MAFEFTDTNFAETALASGSISVVDFWAEWCGPCKLIGPIVEDLASEYEGKVTIGKMNVDDNSAIPLKYGIRSIPTILIIKDGEVVDKHVGTTTKASLNEKIQAHLN
jgi:thioredoxin 1